MNVGFPSNRFFADHGDEFLKIKLDELMSMLGLTVKFGPAYSLIKNKIRKKMR